MAYEHRPLCHMNLFCGEWGGLQYVVSCRRTFFMCCSGLALHPSNNQARTRSAKINFLGLETAG